MPDGSEIIAEYDPAIRAWVVTKTDGRRSVLIAYGVPDAGLARAVAEQEARCAAHWERAAVARASWPRA